MSKLLQISKKLEMLLEILDPTAYNNLHKEWESLYKSILEFEAKVDELLEEVGV